MASNMGGFHFKGKDKRGVSQWHGNGDWMRVLRMLGIGFTIYGICAACAFFAMLMYALLTLSMPVAFHTLLSVSGIHALAFGGSGVWMRKMAHHIRSLDTANQLSARFGVNEETLAAVAQDKGIKPRMNINGTDYYNPADFAQDAFTLLRGTSRPFETQDVLLRPSIDTSATAPEQLLRIPTSNFEATQYNAPALQTRSVVSMETPVEHETPQAHRQ